MRTLTLQDLAHIQQDATTWATCVHLVDANGAEARYTSHDRDLVVSRTSNPFGINGTYLSIQAVTGSAVRNAADLAVDNLEIDALLDDAGITAADIRAGLYDNVRITLFLVNWRDPTNSGVIIKRGLIGQMTTQGNGAAKLEIRGLKQALQQTIVQTYSVSCRADLGDARCGVDLDALTVSGAVDSVGSARLSFASADIVGSPVQADYYTGGLVRFTSGANTTFAREVRTDNGAGVIVLFEPLPGDIQVGDTFTLSPGCAKDVGTCGTKFGNVVNFRGEPFIPSPSALSAGV